LASAALNKII